jgi:GDP-L-fucose synthase
MVSSFWLGKRVLVTGGAGFIGSYVTAALAERGVASKDIVVPRSKDCDLRLLDNCRRAVQGCDIVIHLAAVTGGIAYSRAYPASQYFDSTLIDLNVAKAATEAKVQKMVCIGNMFAYAGTAAMPLSESALFDGVPTDSHRGVGWMKRNLAIMADLFHREYKLPMVVVYSANAYGLRDSMDPLHAHVIPSMIMKCLRDKELVIWGDGTPTRDFLFASDVANGLLLAAERLESPEYVNIGSGNEVSVRQLTDMIVKHTGFSGRQTYDVSKAGGDARRCASIETARRLMGFAPTVSMDDGIRMTTEWYKANVPAVSAVGI